MSKQIITQEEMKQMKEIVHTAIADIYRGRKIIDLKVIENADISQSHYEKGYQVTVFPVISVAQDLKEVRNNLGRLSFSDKTIVENE